MAASGSKKILPLGVSLTVEENSKASSSSRTGQPTIEDVEVLPISGEGASVRDREAGDLPTCSDPKSRSAAGDVTHTVSSGPTLDVGMGSMLPDDLLDKIFARLPFKSFFQVSSLSRVWRARFGSPTFRSGFRSEVLCSSSTSGGTSGSWNSYTILIGNRELEVFGYESVSKQWHRLPTHSYLPQYGVEDWPGGWQLIAGAGSLFCWISRHPNCFNVYEIYVTNALIKSWKKLPRRPSYMTYSHLTCASEIFVQVILEEGSTAYKVLVGTLEVQDFTLQTWQNKVRMEIYDSKDDAWIMETYQAVTTCAVRLGDSALRNGVLYVFLSNLDVKYRRYASCSLISYHVKEKMWNEIPDLRLIISTGHLGWRTCFTNALIPQHFSWTSDVMLVLHLISPDDELPSGDTNSYPEPVDKFGSRKKIRCVFRIDVQRGLAFEESKDSDSQVEMADEVALSLSNAVEQDDCVYIYGHVWSRQQNLENLDFCTRNLYNVRTHRWSWLDNQPQFTSERSKDWIHDKKLPIPIWNSVVYQPQLNPFLEV